MKSHEAQSEFAKHFSQSEFLFIFEKAQFFESISLHFNFTYIFHSQSCWAFLHFRSVMCGQYFTLLMIAGIVIFIVVVVVHVAIVDAVFVLLSF